MSEYITNLPSLINTLQDQRGELTRITVRQLLQRVKNNILEVVRPLFDKNPTLQSFGWKNDPFHYNDENDEFSAELYEPDINGSDGSDISWGDLSDDKELNALQNIVEKFLIKNLNNEFLKVIFNCDTVTHVLVTR